MARPIQSQAPALLNLLGLKNMGALPPELQDHVTPVVDMLPFYLRGAMVNRVGFSPSGGTIFNGGIFPTDSVPANEWWYVESHTAVLTFLGVPTACDVEFFAGGVGSVGPVTYQRGPSFDLALATVGLGGIYPAETIRDFWLPPRSVLGAVAAKIDIANAGGQIWSVTTYTRYTPVQV